MFALVYRIFVVIFGFLLILYICPAKSEEIGCVTTYTQIIGSDFKVCVERFEDPAINNVVCHISHAITGGIGGGLGIASDPSRFSITCSQIGAISIPDNLKDTEEVFRMNTSVLFKDIKVVRMYDRKTNVLLYLLYNVNKLNNSPHNSISSVPILTWR